MGAEGAIECDLFSLSDSQNPSMQPWMETAETIVLHGMSREATFLTKASLFISHSFVHSDLWSAQSSENPAHRQK
jgi:hypothetical protein